MSRPDPRLALVSHFLSLSFRNSNAYNFYMRRLFMSMVILIFASFFFLPPSIASDPDLKEIKAMLLELNKKVDSLEKRIIRLEEGQKALSKRVDDIEKSLNKRIDDLQNYMLTGFAILFAGMFTLIGFVIWDRRTAISPVQNKVRELEEEVFEIRKSLKKYAQKEPKFAEVFKSFL